MALRPNLFVLNLWDYMNKNNLLLDYGILCGNGPHGKIWTEEESIRTFGFASGLPHQIIIVPIVVWGTLCLKLAFPLL